MMKAFGFSSYGASSVLRIVSVGKPVPGFQEIRVKVKAVSVNPTDVKRRMNFGKLPPPKEPVIVGFDGAGVVESVGEGVQKFKVGDEVYFAGNANKQGSYAEYISIDERIVAHKPKSLSFTEAACQPLTALTAFESLGEAMSVEQDKSLLIVAGAGGVGSIAIQLAKQFFKVKTVIATASRTDTEQFCLKMGADHVINHRNNLKEELGKLSLSGVDYVLACSEVTTDSMSQILDVLNPFGKLAIVAAPNDLISFNPRQVMAKRLQISGSFMYARPIYDVEPARQGTWLTQLSQLFDAPSSKLHHRHTQTFNFWTDLPKAHQQLETSRTIGKIGLPLDEPPSI